MKFVDREWDLTTEVPDRYAIKSVDKDKVFFKKHTNAEDADQE